MSQPTHALHSAALEHLRYLVGFDTTSHLSNLALIEYIERSLQELGLETRRIVNGNGEKANLFARIGPAAPGGIVLSGHTDVVPVEGQDWATPPFTLTHKGGSYYGRGTADMKSFIACVLALVPAFLSMPLRRPFYLAFSYDEEIGCLGAPDLVRHIAENVEKPSLAVAGEPTRMEVVIAHKGVYSFETIVTGLEAHSSAIHKGVNAVQVAARLVAFLTDTAEELARSGIGDAGFDPPYSTVHVGVIEGGTARNIIPRHCRFLWEIRPLPSDRPEAIVEKFEAYSALLQTAMRKISPLAAIETKRLSQMRGVQFEAEDGLRQTILACAQANDTRVVSFATEAGVFREFGIPVLICGPGDISQAHKPDEFVEAAQLDRCLSFLERMAETLEN